MKKTLLLASAILLILFTGCKSDVLTAGSGVMPEADAIVVGCDTFSLSSALIHDDYIYSSPDSLMLGECDNMFGTVHADILTQLACPEGFVIPENAEVDSIVLFLYYNTWFGDKNSPMSIKAYALDRGTFAYTSPYQTNLDLSEYWSGEDSTYILTKERIVTASTHTDSVYNSAISGYTPVIRMRLNDDYAQYFFSHKSFASQDDFNSWMKGLYITSSFGSSVILHISTITLGLYYHFSYTRTDGVTDTVSDIKSFYANSEVRKVNHVTYSDEHYDELLLLSDSVNYIVSPAQFFTRLRIPMEAMSDTIRARLGDKRPYVNLAQIRVDVLNVFTGSSNDKTFDDYAQPASNMMLVRENSVNRFFLEHELPQDTCAILATLTARVDTAGNTYYAYYYDISTLLTQQLRDTTQEENLNMVLVPVTVDYSTSASAYSSSTTTTVSAVHPMQMVTATAVRSAQSSVAPMKLEVVYSGF